MSFLALTDPASSKEKEVQSSPVSKASKINDIERDLFSKLNEISRVLNPLEVELAGLNDLPQPLQG